MLNNLKTSISFENVFTFVLALSSCVFLFAPKIVTISFLLIFGVQVFGLIKRKITFNVNKTTYLLVLFYLVYLVGCLFTEDYNQAMKYLEYKLAFILLPILFSFQPTKKIKLKQVFLLYIIGVIGLTCFQLINSFYYYTTNGNIKFFYASYFSFIHHPTYYSSFVLVALGIWFKFFKDSFNTILFYLGCLILLTGIFLSMSLSTLILFFLVIIIALLIQLKKKLSLKYFRLTILISPFIFYLILNFVPVINSQYFASKLYVERFLSNPKQFVSKSNYKKGGNITRLIMWTASVAEIKEHPFGVGTGNVDIYLSKRLKSYDQVEMAEHFYNPHNQYFQTTLEVGLFGLAVLIWLLTVLFFYAYRNKDIVLWLVVASLTFNSLFESMLQRQSGIVYYSFWICILLIYSTKPKMKASIESLE